MRALVRGVATLAALVWSFVFLLIGLSLLAVFVAAFVDGFRGARVEESGARTAVVSAPVPVRRRD